MRRRERSARGRLSQSQCPVGWSPRVLRTPLGFDLAAPFAFSDRTENGYVERFNGKLRDELLNGEIFYTLKETTVLIERWRQEFNRLRPHSSLGYRPPAPETIWLKPAPLHSAGFNQLLSVPNC